MRQKITTISEQLNLFSKIEEKAEYVNNNLHLEIEKFNVKNPESIWLDNASGFYAQIVEALPISIYVKDENSKFTYANAKGRELLNFNEKIIINEKDSDVLTDTDAVKKFFEYDTAVMTSNNKHSVMEVWNSETDEYIVNRTTRYPIVHSDNENSKVCGVVAIAEDLTWKERALVGNEIVHMITHDWLTDLLTGFEHKIERSTDKNIKAETNTFKFVLEYLKNLHIMYGVTNATRDKEIKECDLIADIIIPMQDIMKGYNKLDKYHTLPIIENAFQKIQVNCIPFYLKLLVYQQVRNHHKHGKRLSNLKIEIKKKSATHYSIIFKSPGDIIAAEIQKSFAELTNEAIITVNNSKESIHMGLRICDHIVRLHNGSKAYSYDTELKENSFRYTFTDLKK